MHCHKQKRKDLWMEKVPIDDFIAELIRQKGFNGMLVSDHNSYKWLPHVENEKYKKDQKFKRLCGVEGD